MHTLIDFQKRIVSALPPRNFSKSCTMFFVFFFFFGELDYNGKGMVDLNSGYLSWKYQEVPTKPIEQLKISRGTSQTNWALGMQWAFLKLRERFCLVLWWRTAHSYISTSSLHISKCYVMGHLKGPVGNYPSVELYSGKSHLQCISSLHEAVVGRLNQ